MDRFSDEVRGWFLDAFEAPTDVQARAWDAIAGGVSTLVVAPTGSGKTLAAFLFAIDQLMQQKAQARAWERGVRILYVSPLKALAADVERNLAAPLAGIAERMGGDAGISVGMRTGDTPAAERRKLQRMPPDILITTPESLYLLLTSQAREMLRSVETVIVDEIHSIAGSKRGAHLSLSLERLDDLIGNPAQRIGLSATVEPQEAAARFLGGIQPVRVVADEADKPFDIAVRVPVEDMTAIPALGSGASSIWPYLESSILDEVLKHRSTIVFVNSRGLCEKLTARLNDRYAQRMGAREPAQAIAELAEGALRASFGATGELAGGSEEVIAKAHHGSVSKEKRQAVERDLKRGALRCVVATSSLELGIDMGEVDLVIQVAPPLSVASGLQRIGRANHTVAGRSKAALYPRIRTEVIDAAVAVEGMRARLIERTDLVEHPLDVLAQQTVAAVAMCPDGLAADAWFSTVVRSANYEHLTRAAFDAVVMMLAGRFASGDVAEFAPRITADAASGMLKPLPRSQRLAVTAGGTIPDRGMYPVLLPEGDSTRGRRRVGELDEEMVHESRVGDCIILGTSTWRIKEITGDRVIVEPAPGRQARLPFWHGESVGAGYDESMRRGAFVRAVQGDAEERLIADGLDASARKNLRTLLDEQRAATGAVPDDRTVVIETCRDEAGDERIIVHAPFGRRVHGAWALALTQRIADLFGFDPQAMAADAGIVLRAPATEDMPGLLRALIMGPDEAEALVRGSIGATSLFAARFRECAARALLVSPRDPSRRAPLWQQRVKGGQLLEAARREPDFPLLAEAARECLQDVYDLAGMRRALADMQNGIVRVHEAATQAPSPFAAPLLFGYVADHLYEGDLPHAERRSALLSVDPALLGELLGGGKLADVLDAGVIAAVHDELQRLAPGRRAHGLEGAHELLRQLGPLSAEEVACRMERCADQEASAAVAASVAELDAECEETCAGEGASGEHLPASEARALLEQLACEHRAFPTELNGVPVWAAVEDAPRLAAVLGCAVPAWAAPVQDDGQLADGETLLDGLVARILRTSALVTAVDIAERLGLGPALVVESLRRLGAAGRAIESAYPADADAPSWVDADVLSRLRGRSLAAARRAVQPVDTAAYLRFLFERQGIGCACAEAGADRVAEVIAQFEGVRLPAQLWEGAVFPARVKGYEPAMLDELLEGGDVVWVGSKEGAQRMVAFYPADSPFCPLTSHMEPAISREERFGLIWLGRAVVDSFALVRRGAEMPNGAAASARPRRAMSRRAGSRYRALAASKREARERVQARFAEDAAFAGHWSCAEPVEADDALLAVSAVDSLCDLYGIVTRDIALHAGIPGGLASLYPVLRRMEDGGEVLRGSFVDGLLGSQFASLDAIDHLRSMAESEEGADRLIVLHADDPANLFGAGIPWPDAPGSAKPARRPGALVVLKGGSLALYATAHCKDIIAFTADQGTLDAAAAALASALTAEAKRSGSAARARIAVRTFNGQPVIDSPFTASLERCGFVRNGLEMRLLLPLV